MKSKFVKYILAGSIASLVMLVSVALFREVFGIWYLLSSTLAFILSFTTSFFLQKFWAFKNPSNENTRKQLVLFFVVSLCNLGLNATGMYILVDVFGIWYLISQFFVTGSLALVSFFVYRVIFRDPSVEGARDR